MSTLSKHSRGAFQYTVLDKIEAEGEKISSTKIRQLFSKGHTNAAKQLLGRYPCVSGTIIEGRRRGRTLGYPTANIKVSSEALLPASGVYAVVVHHDGLAFEAMANLGFNPTFETKLNDPSLEVYLFDYTGDLYGAHVKLEWREFIRVEKEFNSENNLIQEMQNDEHVIRSLFAEQTSGNGDC